MNPNANNNENSSNEGQGLLCQNNSFSLRKCSFWIRRPLNCAASATMAAGLSLMFLAVLLPEDHLTKKDPRYMTLFMAGAFICIGGLFLIKVQKYRDARPIVRTGEAVETTPIVSAGEVVGTAPR